MRRKSIPASISNHGQNMIDPESLLQSEWRELRTELRQWDDCGPDIQGYDGLTRYWCPVAVFEIYWVAERSRGTEFSIYMTEDLELAGFNCVLGFEPSLNWKKELAEAIHWQDGARVVLDELSGTQLELFEE